MPTLMLLIVSNLFMTLAWYGQLRFPTAPLWAAILASWGIALVEYCFAVPANRIGYAGGLSTAQLKVMQEVISMSVFAVVAIILFKEPIGWRYLGAFACLVGAAAFMFWGRGPA